MTEAAMPPFMSQVPATVDAAVANLAAEGIGGPAVAGLDHVVVAVEMHAVARTCAFDPGHHVPARIPVAVGGRAVGADHLDGEATVPEARTEDVADLAVIAARRIERRDADEDLRQRNDLVAAGGHGVDQGVFGVHARHPAPGCRPRQALPFAGELAYSLGACATLRPGTTSRGRETGC
jgi:hypothetical protein